MKYYPVHLDIRGRSCLVVGGGGVGTRKANTLLSCGARVTVVSPKASDELRHIGAKNRIILLIREYASNDLAGMFLVIAATDDEDLNRRVSADAERFCILCNIADRPEKCNFILPAIVQRGDLIITVSTSGKSPALAKKLRHSLEAQFGAEYAIMLELLGAVRKRLLAQDHAPEAHKPIFETLINSDLLNFIRQQRMEEIDRLLAAALGEGWHAKDLLPKAF